MASTHTDTDADPYRLTAADSTPGTASPAVSRGDVARTLLWILLVISVAANTVASIGGADLWVHLACGVVTALCAGTLAVRGLRGRR
ncbi:hypothetical protein [Streptomyces acidicola]|uniref:hypothetical protein n=1 Tax=Streptomyces acidicola TaxID=2596892 RepID=UPI0034450AEB